MKTSDVQWCTDNQGSSDSDQDQPTTEHVEFAENPNISLYQISAEVESHLEDQPTWKHIECAEDQGTVEDEEVVEDFPIAEELDIHTRQRRC